MPSNRLAVGPDWSEGRTITEGIAGALIEIRYCRGIGEEIGMDTACAIQVMMRIP